MERSSVGARAKSHTLIRLPRTKRAMLVCQNRLLPRGNLKMRLISLLLHPSMGSIARQTAMWFSLHLGLQGRRKAGLPNVQWDKVRVLPLVMVLFPWDSYNVHVNIAAHRPGKRSGRDILLDEQEEGSASSSNVAPASKRRKV